MAELPCSMTVYIVAICQCGLSNVLLLYFFITEGVSPIEILRHLQFMLRKKKISWDQVWTTWGICLDSATQCRSFILCCVWLNIMLQQNFVLVFQTILELQNVSFMCHGITASF